MSGNNHCGGCGNDSGYVRSCDQCNGDACPDCGSTCSECGDVCCRDHHKTDEVMCDLCRHTVQCDTDGCTNDLRLMCKECSRELCVDCMSTASVCAECTKEDAGRMMTRSMAAAAGSKQYYQ
jgi:hypothetical protein